MVLFDHERLDVYQLELCFIAWVDDLLTDLKQDKTPRIAEVIDHLERASLSALFNTAEGNGKRQRASRAKFFDDARGSTTECAACLDALVAKQRVSPERVLEGKQMLVRVVSMLTKLIKIYSEQDALKEEGISYGAQGTDGPPSAS